MEPTPTYWIVPLVLLICASNALIVYLALSPIWQGLKDIRMIIVRIEKAQKPINHVYLEDEGQGVPGPHRRV